MFSINITRNRNEHYFLIEWSFYMNNLKIKGNWNEVTGRLKQKFASLTDNGLLFEEGAKAELLGIHLKNLGKIKDDIYTLFKKVSRASLS
jgi:uncharacterized protein YjbJ (UPF0337 family)